MGTPQLKHIVQQCFCFSACSSELSFTAEVSSGQVSGQAWCAGDSDEFQWITLDFGGERKISGEQGILPSGEIGSWDFSTSTY